MDEIKLWPVLVGVKKFGGTIDITDPCYNKDVWCRINDVKIKPGKYHCVAWMGEDDDWGQRCFIAAIYHTDVKGSLNQFFKKNTECLGDIGVDAGMAGFFENKPDYNDEEWANFCNCIRDGHAWCVEEGFFTSSGIGDGCYEVYAEKDENGDIIALEIRF